MTFGNKPSEAEKELIEPFNRQRRNLLLICSAIAILSLAKASVSGVEVGILKIDGLVFRKPAALLGVAWIVLFYFTYRYFVYFMEFSVQKIKSQWEMELNRATLSTIREHISLKVKDANTPYDYKLLRMHEWSYRGDVREDQQSLANGLGMLPVVKPVDVHLGRTWLLWQEVVGIIRFLVLRPAVTEHIFPIVYALGVVVVCGFWIEWDGSFAKLLF